METTGRHGARRVRTIDPELVLQMMRSGRRLTVVDVRRPDEVRGLAGTLPEARSIPLEELMTRFEELGRHPGPVVVVSGHGVRSRLASVELELAGLDDVRSLSGGIVRWFELGYPLASPPAAGPASGCKSCAS